VENIDSGLRTLVSRSIKKAMKRPTPTIRRVKAI